MFLWTLRSTKIWTADLYWQVDGTVCRDCSNLAHNDAIACNLWPTIQDLMKILRHNKEEVVARRELMVARLCSVGPETSQAVHSILKSEDSNLTPRWIQHTRSMLTNLVLVILRLRPYQQRMSSIYSEKYDVEQAVEDNANQSQNTSKDDCSDKEGDQAHHGAEDNQCSAFSLR